MSERRISKDRASYSSKTIFIYASPQFDAGEDRNIYVGHQRRIEQIDKTKTREREREREKQKATTERKSFSMIQENKTKTFFAYFKSVPAKQSCSQCTQINKDSKYDTLKMSTTGTNRL